jgi:aerobic-type carbon monoxide dehydrogenase small subunit (CoxS/CutS family)
MAKATKTKRTEIPVRGPKKTPVHLFINQEDYELHLEPRRTLLDALRKDIGLTGAKKVCDEGTCGACTVIVDGQPVYSCMTLALECEEKSVETIEALSRDGKLHALQQAFIQEDAYQCGFCTPGQIMALKALLDQNLNPTLDEIKRAVSGNLCRCGAYPKIFKAGLRAAELLRNAQ